MPVDFLILKRLTYFVLLLIGPFFAVSCGQQRSIEAVCGVWTAEDSLDDVLYKHILQLDAMEGGKLAVSTKATYLRATMWFDTVSFSGDSVYFWSNHPKVKDTFEGKLEGDAIVGEFERNGQSRRMTFRRFNLQAHRPQTPTRPFPYVEEEVRFANRDSSVVFAGTFTYPEGGGRYPTVLIISGSGPQDRDGDMFLHDPYLVIADYLTRHGIAVLRLDDRNVGETVEAPGADVDFVDDALCAIEFLRGHGRVAKNRMGIIGHSQGGLIAMDAAVAVPDLAAVVTLGSPISVTGPDFFVKHIATFFRDMSHSSKEKAVGLITEIFLTIRDAPSKWAAADLILEKVKHWLQRNRDDEEALAALGLTRENVGDEKAIEKMLKETFERYFTRDRYYILSYDPDAIFPSISCPVLAVYGGHDNRISFPEEKERLDSLIGRWPVELEPKCFARVNHFLQTSNGKSDTEVFELDETVSPEIMELLKRWLTEQLHAD